MELAEAYSMVEGGNLSPPLVFLCLTAKSVYPIHIYAIWVLLVGSNLKLSSSSDPSELFKTFPQTGNKDNKNKVFGIFTKSSLLIPRK